MEHFISKPISRKILPVKSIILKSWPFGENSSRTKISMKKVLKSLFFAMVALLFLPSGPAAESGLHETAKEILQKCSCRYENEQVMKDEKKANTLLLATLLCNCGMIETKMAVACGMKAKARPTATECAMDDSISWAKSEVAWPSELEHKEGSGHGTVR